MYPKATSEYLYTARIKIAKSIINIETPDIRLDAIIVISPLIPNCSDFVMNLVNARNIINKHIVAINGRNLNLF